jgi:hypothetical protein
MERAAALTGPAGRPMIASGYEKAGKRWVSLLRNGMRVILHTCRFVLLLRKFTFGQLLQLAPCLRRIGVTTASEPSEPGVRMRLGVNRAHPASHGQQGH